MCLSFSKFLSSFPSVPFDPWQRIKKTVSKALTMIFKWLKTRLFTMIFKEFLRISKVFMMSFKRIQRFSQWFPKHFKGFLQMFLWRRLDYCINVLWVSLVLLYGSSRNYWFPYETANYTVSLKIVKINEIIESLF